MEANFKPAVDTGKVLNVKNIITTVLIVGIVLWVGSKLMKQTMVLKDNNGNQTGTAELAPKFGWNGKKSL